MEDFTRQACIAALRFPEVREKVLQTYIRSPLAARPHELDLDVDLLLKASFCAIVRLRHDARRAASAALAALLLFSPTGAFAFVIASLVFMVASAVLFSRWVTLRESKLVPFFWPERFDRSALPRELNIVTTPYVSGDNNRERQDLTVHEAARQFVGFGQELNDWKFVVNIGKRSSANKAVEPLSLDDLYEKLLIAMRDEFGGDCRVSFQYFLDGRDLPGERAIAPNAVGRPPIRIPDALAERWRDFPETSAGRRYMISTLHLADQTIFTSAVRMLLHRNLLTFEQHWLGLNPFCDRWYQTEGCNRCFTDSWASGTWELFLEGPLTHLHALQAGDLTGEGKLCHESYQWAYGDMQRPAMEDAEAAEDRVSEFFRWSGWKAGCDAMNTRRPDFGCKASIREQLSNASFGSYRSYEQMRLYSQMIERILFETLRGALLEKGISTEDFDEVRQTIINSGIFIGEGNVNAQNVAVGSSAKVENRRAANGQRSRRLPERAQRSR